jgi:hypothetical protein
MAGLWRGFAFRYRIEEIVTLSAINPDVEFLHLHEFPVIYFMAYYPLAISCERFFTELRFC